MTHGDLNEYLRPKSFNELFPEFKGVRDLVNTPLFKSAIQKSRKPKKRKPKK